MIKPNKLRMDEKRKRRRKETAEVFTPFPLLDKMTESLPQEIWNDPTKTFIDNCCGNGQIILYIINKKLESGSTYIQALSTTYGFDKMKDNIKECKARIKRLLKERHIEYDIETINRILNQNIVCIDTLQNWFHED